MNVLDQDKSKRMALLSDIASATHSIYYTHYLASELTALQVKRRAVQLPL